MRFLNGAVLLTVLAQWVDSELALYNPLLKVVGLLKDLEARAKKDKRKDDDLYSTYVCWAQRVIDERTASNAAAATKIDELETYIADLGAGRIELTSERTDLEKELKELHADIESAKDARQKEHDDFVAAESDMLIAIEALDKSMGVLNTIIDGKKGGALLFQNARMQFGEGLFASMEDASSLSRAVELGEGVLSAGDAVFLKRVLTGDVPRPDWKQLNRKATFKKSYKARSVKIQSVIQKLKSTFESSLKEARDKEAASKKQYDNLMSTKGKQKSDAQSALETMERENGASGVKKEQIQGELDTLKQQVTGDTKTIQQTQAALAQKKTEYKARKALHQQEIEAVGKAISILRDDDARDVFKNTLRSSSLLLLQTRQQSSITTALSQHQALVALQRVQDSVPDPRLSLLISILQAPAVADNLKLILDEVDKLLTRLKDEETVDYKRKQECELDRTSDSTKAASISRNLDENQDERSRMKSEIANIDAEIKDKRQKILQMEKDLKEAQENRNGESGEYQVNTDDLQESIRIMKEAKEVMEQYYAKVRALFLLQQDTVQKRQQQQQQQALKEAEPPSPPPATWEEPYQGQEGDKGIVAIMDMLINDLKSDLSAAGAGDKKSEQSFDKFSSDSKDEIKTINDAIAELTATKAEQEQLLVTAGTQKSDLEAQLEATFKKLDDAEKFCDFFIGHFEVRKHDRQLEMDGLQDAKIALKKAMPQPG